MLIIDSIIERHAQITSIPHCYYNSSKSVYKIAKVSKVGHTTP